MMVSPFAVSPALPKMIAYYQAQGYQAQSVEILFSLSSFAILGVLLIMPFLNRFLSERTTVVVGLLLWQVVEVFLFSIKLTHLCLAHGFY